MCEESDLQSGYDGLNVFDVNVHPIQQELMILTAKVSSNHVITGHLGVDESPFFQNRDSQLAQKHNLLRSAPVLSPTSRGLFKQTLCNKSADPVSNTLLASG